MNLNKIIKDSHNKCITDHQEIAGLIERMAVMPIKAIMEISDDITNNLMRAITNKIFEDYGLDKSSSIEALNYIDLLCLVNGTEKPKISFQYIQNNNKRVSNEMSFQYSSMFLFLIMFLDGEEKSTLLQMFLYISVESLLDYLSGLNCASSFLGRKNFFLHRHLENSMQHMETKITPTTTIRELFTEVRTATRKHWQHYESLENYSIKVLKPYGVVNVLTVGCFQTVYKERFKLNETLNKYYKYEYGFYKNFYDEN